MTKYCGPHWPTPRIGCRPFSKLLLDCSLIVSKQHWCRLMPGVAGLPKRFLLSRGRSQQAELNLKLRPGGRRNEAPCCRVAYSVEVTPYCMGPIEIMRTR